MNADPCNWCRIAAMNPRAAQDLICGPPPVRDVSIASRRGGARHWRIWFRLKKIVNNIIDAICVRTAGTPEVHELDLVAEIPADCRQLRINRSRRRIIPVQPV